MWDSRRALAWGVLVLLVLLGVCRAAPHPDAGTSPIAGIAGTEPKSLAGRRLQGRFLHITDIHPDPFYKTYSSTEADAACHRKHGPAGVYGAETSACDSPVSLVNETFKWINENLKDSIDFVIWTGDSARHDNDEEIPRTEKQVLQQNEFVVSKFAGVFGHTIPIVPTFGNNDIMPHNIFLSGPNKWTTKYLDIWRGFIPEAQRHSFHEGGWFYVEVIPTKLAVFSLNTLYFFDSNSGVDGCADKHEPGYEHMEWLRIQLRIMRERGMKVILIGHVPPARTDSKLSWDETCWQKFTLWERQYRDIIVGSLFGHMNIDHFMLQDFNDLKKDTKKGRMASASEIKSLEARETMLEDGEITVSSASDYLISLRDAWSNLPTPPTSKKDSLSMEEFFYVEEGFSIWQWINSRFSTSNKGGQGGKGDKKRYLDEIGGRYAERYSTAHVAPSVVPNFYPTLRVFTYNISGLEHMSIPDKKALSPSLFDQPGPQLPVVNENGFSDDAAWEKQVSEIVAMKKQKKERDERNKPKRYKFKVPGGPSKSAPPGPAYSPQSLTLLGYVQYYANLTHINNDFVQPSSIDEGVAGNNSTVFGLEYDIDGNVEEQKWKEGKHHKHQGKRPREKPHPRKFKFEVEYDTQKDKQFKLKDLTVRRYVDLARRIGQQKAGKTSVLDAKEEYVEREEEGEGSGEEEVDIDKKGKKKKGGKHGKKKRGKNSTWFTFVKRAFVGTMDPHEIEELFGRSTAETEVEGEEIMEL